MSDRYYYSYKFNPGGFTESMLFWYGMKAQEPRVMPVSLTGQLEIIQTKSLSGGLFCATVHDLPRHVPSVLFTPARLWVDFTVRQSACDRAWCAAEEYWRSMRAILNTVWETCHSMPRFGTDCDALWTPIRNLIFQAHFELPISNAAPSYAVLRCVVDIEFQLMSQMMAF